MSEHNDPVTHLTLKLADGRLTDAERLQLAGLLEGDPAALEMHVALLEQEAVLRGCRLDLDLAEATLALVKSSSTKRTASGVLQKIRRRQSGADGPAVPTGWAWLGGRRFWQAAAGLAAAVLLTISGISWHISSRQADSQEAFLYGRPALVPGVASSYRVLVRDGDGHQLIEGASVMFAVYDPQKKVVWESKAVTDAYGMAVVEPKLALELPDGQYTVQAVVDSSTGHSKVSRSVSVRRSFKLLVTSDKPLYQPGQTIHLRTLALSTADMRPAAKRRVVLEVADAKGNKVFKKFLETSRFGIASADFELAQQVNMGRYQITASLGDTTSSKTVTVKRYVLPKFRVDVTTGEGFYSPGQTITGSIDARYTFGKPVARGQVNIVAKHFVGRMRPVATAEGTTDDEGRFAYSLQLPQRLVGNPRQGGDAAVFIEATVVDAAGHTQTKSVERIVARQPIRIAVLAESGLLVPGVINRVYIVTAYPNGRPAQTRLRISGFEAPVETSAAGVASVELEPRLARNARLTVTAEDAQGRTAQASANLNLDRRDASVLLRTDRPIYRTGDTASITVLSNSQRGRVFIDLVKEGRTVLTEAVQLSQGQGKLALDLSHDLFGTLELHAYHIRVNGEIVGDVKLIQVNRSNQLQIQATLDKKTYRPAEKAVLNLAVTRSDGKPVQAALSLAGVDEAVFALSEARPGLARVYFMLQEELLEPRYQIDTRVPFNPHGVMTVDQPDAAQQEAGAVLTAMAGASSGLARDAGRTWSQKRQVFDREEREWHHDLQTAALLTPSGLLLLLLLPLLIYAGQTLIAGQIPGDLDRNQQSSLRSAGRSLAMWWVGGLYLPWAMMLFGLLLVNWRPELYGSLMLLSLTCGGVYLLRRTEEGRRSTAGPVWWYGTAVVGMLGAIVLSHEVTRWQPQSLLFTLGVLASTLTLVGLWRGVRKFREQAWAAGQPLLAKLTCVLPVAQLAAITGFFGLIAAVGQHPRHLTDQQAAPLLLGIVALVLLTVAALTPLVYGATGAIGRGRWLGLALSRLLIAACPLVLIFSLPTLSTSRGLGARSDSLRAGTGMMIRTLAATSRGQEAEVTSDEPAGFNSREILGGDAANQRPVRVRRYFPETLLWRPQLITDEQGRARLEIPLADSITTWRLSMNAVSGKGELGSSAIGLRVFQPFFVDIDFPAALTQHDRISVPIAVYNYLDKPQKVRLEVQRQGWFTLHGEPVREVTVGARQVTGVRFEITAEKPGVHALQVRAHGAELADAVERKVLVEPDGKRVVSTINGRIGEGEGTHEITIPPTAIEGASDLLVKIYPGAFSEVIEGLEGIFRMPGGCFEQTSSSTYPNVLVLDYMRRNKMIKPEVEMKATRYISQGYQRLVSFECKRGGFEWFGHDPAHIVLTAYGLMEFVDMARVHEVDPALIARTRQWLLGKQRGDGTWLEASRGIAEGAINGKQGNVLRTTAYVAWALGQSLGDEEPDSRLSRALDHIASQALNETDPYTLALCANALVVGGHDAGMAVLTKLDGLKQKTDGKGVKWTSTASGVTHSRGNVLAIETSALAVQAYLVSGYGTATAHAALRWLSGNKDQFGTWSSTQATVHAMRALLAGAGPGAVLDKPAHVTVIAAGQAVRQLKITPETSDVYRLISLRDKVRIGDNTVSLESAGGEGLAYQVVAVHYVPWPKQARPAKQPLTIDVRYENPELSVDDLLTCRVEVAYHRRGTAKMTMVDLGIPPGFAVQRDSFEQLKQRGLIEKYQIAGRQVILYLRNLESGKPFRFTYQLLARFPVAVKTPRSRTYQYYEPDVLDVAQPVRLVVKKK